MTPQFIEKNYLLIKKSLIYWLNNAKENAQYGSAIFGGGDIRKLEQLFCNIFSCKYSLAVSSATAALHSALVAMNINSNSNVIISGSNWSGLTNLVNTLGAKPIIVNHIDLFNYINNINAEENNILIFVRVKNDKSLLKEVSKICKEKNIAIIEDWSALKDIKIKNKVLPLYGEFAIFSFGYDKWIQAGEGGIILLNNKQSYNKIIEFTQHPISQKTHMLVNTHNCCGLNYRIHPIAASLILFQLKEKIQISN